MSAPADVSNKRSVCQVVVTAGDPRWLDAVGVHSRYVETNDGDVVVQDLIDVLRVHNDALDRVFRTALASERGAEDDAPLPSIVLTENSDFISTKATVVDLM